MLNKSRTFDNNLIAKNTFALYFRMLIVMLVGLFTSRVVLHGLGVKDYGIFNLVAGVVVVVNILSSSLNASTSRFLTFQLGKSNSIQLSKTFSTAFFIHLLLSILVLTIGETIGLWFINTQLVIDDTRLFAANCTYQAALISTFFSITQIPYNASIISHEKMGIFALIEIIHVLLKLLIAFVALHYDNDRLILYSALYCVVSVLVMFLYRFYCINKFQETHIRWGYDKGLFKQMLSFSGWSLFANVGETSCKQGVNIILNRAFGTIINGATGVALQVQAVLYGFIGNITTAFSPQIVKEYAKDNINRVNQLIFIGTKLTSLLTLIITVPVFIKLDLLMKIWLEEVPQYSVSICRLLLIHNFTNSFNPMLMYSINATGDIKGSSVFAGCVYFINIIVAYLILKFTNYAPLVFCIFPVNSLLICFYNIFKYHKKAPTFKHYLFLFNVVFLSTTIGLVTLMICYWINIYLPNNIIGCFLIFVISSIIVLILSIFVFFNKHEREYVISKFKSIYKRL